MRRLAVIPLALFLGCWDFDSLSGTYVPPVVDASTPGDMACGKSPNTRKEDCTQNTDVNNNCLVGCEDPDCFDHVACFAAKGYKGYGAVVDNANKCPGQSTQSMVFQNLAAPPANCNSNCQTIGANSNTSCTSMLHVYPTQNDCTNKTNDAKVNLATGAACTNVTSVKDSYYSVDKLTAGGACTPKMASLSLPAVWGTTSVLCDQTSSGIDTFAVMQNNGIACVLFNGTDPAVCASTKIYTKPSVYYQGTTMNNSVTCTCAAASTGTCNLADGGGAGLLNLSDKAGAMCTTGAMLTPIKTDSTCLQTNNGMNTYVAMSVSNTIPAPACNITGAVTGAYVARDGITACCM